MPNSIARVNARFAGGIASSKVSANPRGQRTNRNIVAEKLDKTVGECDAGPPIGETASRMTLQHRRAP